jgi:hypothetical protein
LAQILRPKVFIRNSALHASEVQAHLDCPLETTTRVLRVVFKLIVKWRNWLAQDAYTVKVVGSSPTFTTNNYIFHKKCYEK